MRILLVSTTILILLVLLSSCKSSDSTEPIVEDNIVDFIDPEACDYWISFYPDEAKGQYSVVWDCETGGTHDYALTFNGEQVDLTQVQHPMVSATPGATYNGILYVDEASHPFTIKIAHNISSATCESAPSTPHLSWTLPSSNMHQFVEAWYTTEDGEDFVDISLPANKREYTLTTRAYTSVQISTLNSYSSSDKKFGAYSWSHKEFSFDK